MIGNQRNMSGRLQGGDDTVKLPLHLPASETVRPPGPVRSSLVPIKHVLPSLRGQSQHLRLLPPSKDILSTGRLHHRPAPQKHQTSLGPHGQLHRRRSLNLTNQRITFGILKAS